MKARSFRLSISSAVGMAMWLISPATFAQQDPQSHSPRILSSTETIRALLTERLERNGVGIVVGVVDQSGSRVVAYGKSGARNGRPLDGDTIFQIGSVTKTLTGLLLADMVQRGEVRLDDPISRYLPSTVHLRERTRPITFLDLATHQSGLPSMPTNFDLHGKPNPIESYTTRQLYEFLSSYELSDPPGTKPAYSNLGVALMGRLLAAHLGMNYEEALKKRVLLPLGMNDTSITLTANQKRRLAPGHDRYLQPVETWEMVAMPASGSARSTANDLLKLLSAYLGYAETPLKAAMDFQRNTRQPVNGSRALGLGIRRATGEEQFAHDGGKEGYRAGIVFNPRRGTGVVVLANARTDDLPINIAYHIDSARPLPPPTAAPALPVKVSVKRTTLETYAGRYRLSPTETLAVARRADHLLIDWIGNGVEPYYASSVDRFYSNAPNNEIQFSIDRYGRVDGLIVKEGTKERRAERL